MTFPFGQRLIVTFADQHLDEVAYDPLADGWVHRSVPRSFARASADQWSRHAFEIIGDRTLPLGCVDLDAG